MPIVELQEAKTYLRFPNPSQPSADDTIIAELIDGIEEIVVLHCGAVTPKTHVEKYQGGDCSIFLQHAPLVAVNEVRESWGFNTFVLDQVDPSSETVDSIYAYSIDNYDVAQITRRTAAGVTIPFVNAVYNGIQVTYTAGRETVPAAVAIGVKELLAHIYQGSLQRGVSLSGSTIAYDAISGSIIHNPGDGSQVWVGLPTRLLQFFESERRLPIIA
jgi:hypothetical protein